MIWALLAILGVPLWLLAGVLLGVALSRRNFRRQEGVFALVARPEGAAKWPRLPVYGRQIRDVLVVNRGLALLRTRFHAVDNVAALPLGIGAAPKRLGDAVGWILTLHDGTRLEVATNRQDAPYIEALLRPPLAKSNL